VTLHVFFSGIFTYVLIVLERISDGEQPSFGPVRSDVEKFLEQQEAAAKDQGSLEPFQAARFPVVVWIDEMLLTSSWHYREQWKACTLQEQYYGIRYGGEEFFVRLDTLRPEQQEVREIYYLCLGLGFGGRYADDLQTLRHFRQAQAQYLPLAVEDVAHLDKFTPQPYSINPHDDAWRRRTLLVFGLLGIGLLFLVWRALSPPSLSVGVVEQALRNPPRILECAQVAVDTVHPRTRTVALSGHIANDEQKTNILRRVAQVPGVVHVTEILQMIPWPFCEVMELVAPFQELALPVQLKTVYRVGDPLIVQGTAPPFASYVYVDYFTVRGGVWHIFPNAWDKELSNPLPPYTSFAIGNDRVKWRINRPIGQELVLAIASKSPLALLHSTQKQHAEEPAAVYIPRLRTALAGVATTDLAAVYVLIQTQVQP
jgi:type VI secretion system protein ImpK